MKSNALIVTWRGKNIPDYLVAKVAEVLTTNGICTPELLTIVYKDEEGIANALIRGTQSSDDTPKREEDDVAEAVKQSVIYIGERFKDSLSGTSGHDAKLAMFAIELSNAVATARRNMSFIGVGSNDELLTAIEVLSTVKAVIPASLAKRYHFTQSVVEVIKKIYKSY